MPKLLLDFTGVNIDDPEPVPAGVYEAVIDGRRIELRKSQNDNDVLSVPFVILDPPEYANRIVFENYAITDKAKWKLGQLLKAIGLWDEDNRQFVLDTDRMHNKRVKIQVSIEEYNGRTRNRAQKVVGLETPAASETSKRAINF